MMRGESVRRAFSRTAECPALESLEHDLALPMGNRNRGLAEDHLQSCLNCRTNLELAREFEVGEMRPDEKKAVAWITARLTSPVEPPRTSRLAVPWWKSLFNVQYFAPALAAAAVLVAVVGISMQQRMTVFGPVTSDLRDDRVRAGGIALATPVGDVSRMPAEFCWSSVPGSAGYQVSVTEVDRNVVYQSRVTGICIPTPRAVQKVLVPGKTLQWHVIAVDESGKAVARSETESFRIPIKTPDNGGE